MNVFGISSARLMDRMPHLYDVEGIQFPKLLQRRITGQRAFHSSATLPRFPLSLKVELLPNEPRLDANADFHPLGARRLRLLRNILLYGRNSSLRFMPTLVGDVSTKCFLQCAAIIGKYLSIPPPG
jgi:hypothetical protein